GEALWVFDPAHDRWCYCDGLELQTYAAAEEPSPAPTTPPPRHTPYAPTNVPYAPTETGEP
ncbi:hypothetical protein J0670_38535, partial [Streptomyces sp. FH025]|nr:hypothetical protein [Streptomyces sp. FH025]